MEAFLILVVLLVAAIPIAVIYLLISNANLKGRVDALEEHIAKNAAKLPATPIVPKQSTPVRAETAQKPPVAATPKVPDPVPEPAIDDIGPPKAVALHSKNVGLLIKWIMQNWFYAVSAVSLALAGIFLVLYGVEQGLLPPGLRIMAALVFGGVLVGAGEYVRRRYGDDEGSTTAYLPSTFSGAGIVTLFATVLSARLLYGFIGPEIALVGMALVGLLALILGWFYGPLLAAVGVIGAIVAPFVVGGSSDNPSWLLVYFTIVVVAGLGIDTIRRWAWVSIMALSLGYGAGLLLMLGSGWQLQPYFVIYCATLMFAAIAIPVRRLVPDHAGTPLSLALFAHAKGDSWPEFPTRLAGGAVVAASGLISLTAFETARPDLFWVAVVMLTLMLLGILVWARNATAITDLAAIPAAALIAIVASCAGIWRTTAIAAQEPGASLPLMASVIVAIGLVISALAAWRSLRGGPARDFVALGAAVFAPTLAIVIEVCWNPAATIGAYVWALHAMAIGALMAVMAERFARADGPDNRLRASFAVLSALACIAFGVVILFTSAALTIAIAVTIVAAAWLDRQFNLPLMGLYILAGITAVGYRLVIDPGIDWAINAPLPEMLLSHAGAVIAFAASWVLARSAKRPRSEVLLESAVFSSSGILLSLLLYRIIEGLSGQTATASHWTVGIGATIWIALGMAQLRRLEIGGSLAALRKIAAVIFLLMAATQIVLSVTLLNPLLYAFRNAVVGPSLLNTLIPAYLLPAATLLLGARWLYNTHRTLRLGFVAVALALASCWLGLTIRHFWRGAEGMLLPDIGQPELYSYTVAILVVGAVLFYQSLARSSVMLRKAGLVVIGLAVAKVFMVDIGGLGGLIRVFSLLFLGLALAGLAWLNRWAAERANEEPTDS
ncbi:DUF2339 domain-containing protein [Yoonia tamlensis]|uniref:DUF2339 domain-containing protein n=1 Tax=Yoonia tamlensis TaxID=390270 RepID=UPI000A455411|nr:DUF2339 domain-containing protein [Yoonia tamlensis]